MATCPCIRHGGNAVVLSIFDKRGVSLRPPVRGVVSEAVNLARWIAAALGDARGIGEDEHR